MTPAQLVSIIRWKANVDSNFPYDNTSLLPVVNIAKDDIAQAIMEKNSDYFGEISTFTTVSAQGEYTNPADLLLFKRIEISYTNTSTGSYYPVKFVSLEDLQYGTDWYALNQPTDQPIAIADDTGYRIYPHPTATTAGATFGRIFYVPKRADLANLTEASTDVATATGIGAQFHSLIADEVVNMIKEKQGLMTPSDVRKFNDELKDQLVPAAFRNISMPRSDIPSDGHLQY